MPILHLVTNVQIPDAKAFALELSKLGAEVLKKPEQYIAVTVTYNELRTFAGSFDPALNLSIESLNNINAEANQGYSKAFFQFFEEKLGTPGNRGYITFIDLGRENWGHEGTTIAAMFRGK